MLSLLGKIADFIVNIGTFLLNAVIDAVNLVIVALGALIGVVLGLLPGMPDAPSIGASNNWLGWLNYYLPISGLLVGLTVFVGLYSALLVLRIALRWVKAL